MRRYLAVVVALISATCFGQSASPQTARQALIEMFFGQMPNHLEKHLPDVTRRSLSKFGAPGGEVYVSALGIAEQIRAGGTNLQLFDTGPTLLLAEDAHPGSSGNGPDKVEITVERDDLVGDEDQIELALHLSRNGKEEALPVIPRFTFSMQTEADVWRLNEISVNVRVPLADPNFLKTMEGQQRTRNELVTMSMLRLVNGAETNYSKAKGRFACSLSSLGSQYLYDPQLVKGSTNGYNYVISGCDASHYKIVAEPAVSDTEQRAFCSDESGEIRAAADGKATTCLSNGESVPKALGAPTTVLTAPPSEPATAEPQVVVPPQKPISGVIGPAPPPSAKLPQRIRVSAGVMQGLLISHEEPRVPADAARLQGSVIMDAVIGKDGTVQELKVLKTASPLLNQAAQNAARQWKYKPYLLNGQAIEVNTTITVNFKFPQP